MTNWLNYHSDRMPYFCQGCYRNTIKTTLFAHQFVHLQASLSAFFSALFLKPLDQAFKEPPGIFSMRCIEVMILLIRTQKQYRQAGKMTLFERKRTAHYLKLAYDATELPHPCQKNPENLPSHNRSHLRALDKLQCYLLQRTTSGPVRNTFNRKDFCATIEKQSPNVLSKLSMITSIMQQA